MYTVIKIDNRESCWIANGEEYQAHHTPKYIITLRRVAR